MNDGLLPNMQEALRLTREGKLLEATSLLQRNLGNGTGDSSRQKPTVDAESWITDERSYPAPPDDVDSDSERTPDDEGGSPHRPMHAPMRPAARKARSPRKVSRSGFGFDPSSLGVGSKTGYEVSAPRSSGTGAPGEYTERVFSTEAGSRRYGLYVPTGYIGQEVPLVVMLHGCTQSARDFASGTQMNELAEEFTFLVAYPEQSSSANATRCWNWFRDSDQHRDRGEPSIISGITSEISSEYNVRERSVYIAGLSAGGAMAAVMASLYPEVYSAVGVHSGLAPGLAHDMMSAFSAMNGGVHTTPGYSRSGVASGSEVPVIVFQGDRDGTVAPKNAEHVLTHFGHSDGTLRESIEGQSSEGLSYTRRSFGRKDERSPVSAESWTVHGLAHAWSGGSRSGSYTDSRGPDASREMVRFFLERTRV